MDIYLVTTPDVLRGLLQSHGFVVTWKRNHFSAMRYVPGGRYHVLYDLIDGETFCDFHYDNTIHAIGTGADYGKKPEAFFADILKADLKKMGIAYRVKRVNWFTRRNKAIITGFRI